MKRYLMTDIWIIVVLCALCMIIYLNTRAVEALTRVISTQTDIIAATGISDEKLYEILKGEEDDTQ